MKEITTIVYDKLCKMCAHYNLCVTRVGGGGGGGGEQRLIFLGTLNLIWLNDGYEDSLDFYVSLVTVAGC